MLLFSAENLAQNFAGTDIFKGVNFEVQAGEKLAIVGANGVGKSSLLRIIAGIDQAVEGSVKYYNRASCGLLTQYFDDAQMSTVLEALEEALPAGAILRSPGEALKKFAFTGRETQLVANLSGGEKTRLQLARIWLSGAELLLLDEPGNHLDAENLEWLESFINQYPDTVVLVSHDRYFLDRTVKRVLELRSDGITSYAGNYSAYYQAKLEQRARNEKIYWDQQKQAEKLNDAIQEQKIWAGKAHDQAARKASNIGIKNAKVFYRNKAKKTERRVKNNIKRLERLEEERIARPEKVRTIDLSFTGERRAHKEILRAEDIAKAFNSRSLFMNGQFSLKYGEKAALVGANGSGKTTLLRIIAGLETLDAGGIWCSPSLRLGYLEQEVKSLDQSHSVLHELAGICPDQGRVRNLLADLLITGDAVFKPCRVLSMGEKVRVALAKMLLGTYDLLLLDEPTNYLDLPSREKLENALAAFGGSLVIVSHDRYLLAKVAQKVWVIENAQVTAYPGNYPDYIEHRSICHSQQQAGESDRLELEIKKARLISELSMIDRSKDEGSYLRREQEFLEVIRRLRDISG